MRTLYLAGFDVFREDSIDYGKRLKALCRRYGFDGFYPLDNAAPADLQGPVLATWIYQANVALIQRADAVMANVNPFRGAEPDSGTAFEMGYAVALGKPVWAYTEQHEPLVRQCATRVSPDLAPRYLDAQGYTVEDFGLNLNLMLACSSVVVVGDAEQCLQEMARALHA